MPDRDVRAVAFDVNETLFPLDGLRPAFAEVGLDSALVPLWFVQLLRDGFALTAMGLYRPFIELADVSLRALDPDQVDNKAVETVLAAFRELAPHPDVERALRMLHESGIPAITLTNGSAEVVNTLLVRAGLADLVQRTVSVDDVRQWKPATAPYLRAADVLDVEPRQLALVACHPWDCAGARAAGLLAGWVNRTGAPWPTVFDPPDVTGEDLPATVAALITPD